MSHSPGRGHRNTVWRPAPGWEEGDDGVGKRRMREGSSHIHKVQHSSRDEYCHLS